MDARGHPYLARAGVTGMQENEDPWGEVAVRAVLVCSWTVVENRIADGQGRAQEGPEEVGGFVRE